MDGNISLSTKKKPALQAFEREGKGNPGARGGGKGTPPCFPLACGLSPKFPSLSNACHNDVIYTQGSRKFCISDKCKVKFIPSYICMLSYLI